MVVASTATRYDALVPVATFAQVPPPSVEICHFGVGAGSPMALEVKVVVPAFTTTDTGSRVT